MGTIMVISPLMWPAKWLQLRKSITYLTSRYNRYIPYRPVNRYKYSLVSTRKNTGCTGEYRSFRVESKNRPIQKASLKKKKKKNTKYKTQNTKHKSTKWLTSPSGSAPLCWSALTFSWFSLRIPPSISSVHFLSSFFFFFFLFFLSVVQTIAAPPLVLLFWAALVVLFYVYWHHTCRH